MKHAVVGAVFGAVAGFSLAGAALAVTLQPTYWVPTVERVAQASVTEVHGDRVKRPEPYGGTVRRTGVRTTVVIPSVVAPPTTATPSYVIPDIPAELGIPGIVLAAYRQAEQGLATTDPSCHLDWPMLAGIGKVESDHAAGGRVWADGTTFAPILGPVLDGTSTARIPDTDDGYWDGDTVWDRAVGPMQFIPSTWAYIGADGNGDGVASPHNVFDAALTAGKYLCAGGGDLSVRTSLASAILTYNHSSDYVALVMAWIDGYRAGHVTPLPPQPSPPPTATPTTSPPTTSPPTTSPPTGSPTTTPPTTAPPTTEPPTTPPTTEPPTTPPPTIEPTSSPTGSGTTTQPGGTTAPTSTKGGTHAGSATPSGGPTP